MDPESGAQPIHEVTKTYTLAVNGEIYNYKELQAMMATNSSSSSYVFQIKSDCEVILPLYQRHGIGSVKELRGMFSYIFYDEQKNIIFAVRDHLGITPLYYGYAADGAIWFASEMKDIEKYCVYLDQFPPGHYWDSLTNELKRWYTPLWLEPSHLPVNPIDYTALKLALEKAVERRMMADVPWGVLLSGGLDSSLVASIAARKQKALVANQDEVQWCSKLHSFTVGLQDSPDLYAAEKGAKYLGTIHHSYTYTIQEGLDAVKDVIYHVSMKAQKAQACRQRRKRKEKYKRSK